MKPIIATLQNYNFYYYQVGNPSLPTIFILNGYLDSIDKFSVLYEKLKDSFHLVSLDLPTRYYPETSFSIDDLVEYCHQIISYLHLKNLTFVGFSVGGMIAYEYARKYPNEIKKLYLLSSSPYFQFPWLARIIIKNIPLKYFPRFCFYLWSRVSASNLMRRFSGQTLLTQDQHDNIVKNYFSILSTMYSVLQQIFKNKKEEIIANYQSLPISKKIVISKNDPVIKYKKYRSFFEQNHWETIVLEKGGHGSTREYWEEVTKILYDSLKSNEIA